MVEKFGGGVAGRYRHGWLMMAVLLALSSGGGAAAETRAAQAKITLLSDEAADACIRDIACMQALFLQAAFAPEGDDQPAGLYRWPGPVWIMPIVAPGVAADRQEEIQAALERITLVAKAAGVEFGVVPDGGGEVVNLMLLVSDDFARDRDAVFGDLLDHVMAGDTAIYDALLAVGRPVCGSRRFVTEGAAIRGGFAMLESDGDAAATARCLHRTILTVLGLDRDLPDADSLLNSASERDALTSIDYLLLRLLYDPAIEPGMTRKAAEAVFPDLYARLLGPTQ
jgi:hypothetical protein